MANCIHPITLKDGRSVPCGKCFACLSNRQRDWTFRLDLEKDNCSFFLWLTLTYADEYLPLAEDGRPMVSKDDCREFFERMRKRFPHIKFKHFLVSEYGPNPIIGEYPRPHYHCILYGNCNTTNAALIRGMRNEVIEYLDTAWGKGFAYNKRYHKNVHGYVSKYCCKPDLIGLEVPVPVFTLISQGIGERGLKKFDIDGILARDFLVGSASRPRVLPRYLRDKVEAELETRLLEMSDTAFIRWKIADATDRVARQARRFEAHRNMVAEYDRVHGAGAFNKLSMAQIQAKQCKFIRTLKKRQNG